MLQQSIYRTDSGFNESWELIGDDPHSNIRATEKLQDTPNRHYYYNKDKTKVNVNALRTTKINCSGRSLDECSAGYASSFTSTSTAQSSPARCDECPPAFISFDKEAFIRRLFVKTCINPDMMKQLDPYIDTSTEPWMKLCYKDTVFLEIGHVILATGTRNDLVDIINDVQTNTKHSKLIIYANRNRDDYKRLLKNLVFMGFQMTPIKTVESLTKINIGQLNTDNTYLEYTVEDSSSGDSECSDDDLIEID